MSSWAKGPPRFPQQQQNVKQKSVASQKMSGKAGSTSGAGGGASGSADGVSAAVLNQILEGQKSMQASLDANTAKLDTIQQQVEEFTQLAERVTSLDEKHQQQEAVLINVQAEIKEMHSGVDDVRRAGQRTRQCDLRVPLVAAKVPGAAAVLAGMQYGRLSLADAA